MKKLTIYKWESGSSKRETIGFNYHDGAGTRNYYLYELKNDKSLTIDFCGRLNHAIERGYEITFENFDLYEIGIVSF